MNSQPRLPVTSTEQANRSAGGQRVRSDILAVVVAGHPGFDHRATSLDLAGVFNAIAEQTVGPDRVVLIQVPSHDQLQDLDDLRDQALDLTLEVPGLPPVSVVTVPHAQNFAQAVTIGLSDERAKPLVDQSFWIWMLNDDCQPEPACLEELWRMADRGKTVAVVGPKQVKQDGQSLLEFGIQASRSGKRLHTIAPGEIDQGQYNWRVDVLAVGTQGMLVRRNIWRMLGGLDPALGPFGDDLEFGRRVRRAGFRVVVAARAVLRRQQACVHATAADSNSDTHAVSAGYIAGNEALWSAGELQTSVPQGNNAASVSHAEKIDKAIGVTDSAHGVDIAALKKTLAARLGARWYNWVLAEPWYLVAPLMAWLAISLPMRTLGFLVMGDRLRSVVQWRAWWWVFTRTFALLKSRGRVRRQARLPRNTLKPLEATRRDFWRQNRLNAHIKRARLRARRQGDPLVAASLHRWRLRSWFTFVGLLAASAILTVVVWLPEFSGLAGASWAGVPWSWSELWLAAWSAWVGSGDPIPGMNDPVLMPLTVLTAPFALIGVAPTAVLRGLLLAATPLAVAAMWWCASRFTFSIALRCAASACWAFLPVLTQAVSTGRVVVVVFHVLAPLALGVAVSWWGSAGAGGGPLVAGPMQTLRPLKRRRLGGGALALIVAAMICIATWLLAALWVACIAATLINRRKGAYLWLISVPATVLVAPFIVNIILEEAWPVLVTTGGTALAGPAGASWTLLGGLTSAVAWISTGVTAAFLSAEMGMLWVTSIGVLIWGIAIGSRHMRLASVAVTVAVIFLGIAWAQHLLPVAARGVVPVSADVSPALDLAALSLLIGLMRTLTRAVPWNDQRHRKILPVVAALILASLISGSTWAWQGPLNTAALDHIHAASRQVPAVIANAQQNGQDARLLVVHSSNPWQISDWTGDGPMLTDASAILRWQGLRSTTVTDVEQALVTTLVAPDNVATQTLAEHHVAGILISEPNARTASVEAALDRAPGIERVGDTDQGRLWRVGQTAPLGAMQVVYEQPWWALVWQIASGLAVAVSVIFIFPRRRSA